LIQQNNHANILVYKVFFIASTKWRKYTFTHPYYEACKFGKNRTRLN